VAAAAAVVAVLDPVGSAAVSAPVPASAAVLAACSRSPHSLFRHRWVVEPALVVVPLFAGARVVQVVRRALARGSAPRRKAWRRVLERARQDERRVQALADALVKGIRNGLPGRTPFLFSGCGVEAIEILISRGLGQQFGSFWDSAAGIPRGYIAPATRRVSCFGMFGYVMHRILEAFKHWDQHP